MLSRCFASKSVPSSLRYASLLSSTSARTISSTASLAMRGNMADPYERPPLRSYPQYSVFGENCMLALKLILPAFKLLSNNVLVLDSNKKGRILLEWTPRAPDGAIQRDRQVRFGLSPEEIGFMLDQLPDHQVELIRRAPPTEYGMSAPTLPDKVLRITPMDGGMVCFAVEHEYNDATPTETTEPKHDPLDVTVQLGEFQVITEIMRTSIPQLVGWTTMTEIAMQRNLNDVLQGRDSRGDAGGGLPF